MSAVKKPTMPSLLSIWFFYALAATQVVHYYFWDHEADVGMLFGAMFWFITGKSLELTREIQKRLEAAA